jgi:hypothetical protein
VRGTILAAAILLLVALASPEGPALRAQSQLAGPKGPALPAQNTIDRY